MLPIIRAILVTASRIQRTTTVFCVYTSLRSSSFYIHISYSYYGTFIPVAC
jgi:hypothetical protein